jgi:hypothetical protein
MTGGIVQRNYATNEIAIMDIKKMHCLQAWKQCTVAGAGASMESYPVKKICFPLGRHHDH